MTLTYALHRAFSDLGPAMTEHWQIFLNADFILASGSLRSVIRHLSRGERIVASPSYCTIAEEVIPELRRHLDTTTPTLSMPPRELARLVLQHRHPVIQGKTVNQQSFHMRYADQFYWSVDDSTLIGYQMPVSIVGLRPERYVAKPNSYWDYGLIWEYCPRAEICVIGDSDDFVMLELRDSDVAQDQIIPGPPDKKAIAERMIAWVTPYQQHFLNFPLTIHDRDLPPIIDDARVKLRSFVDEVMSNAPPLPSHIKHSQWEYHWANFQDARRLSSRVRSWAQKRFGPAQKRFGAKLQSVKRKAVEMCERCARVVGDRYARPALRWLGLEIIKSANLLAIQKAANESYQFKLERSYDYQALMAQDQLRAGMSNLEPEFLALYEQCRQYTMTSWERLYALYKSVQYVVENKIPGDLVECGVWRGGSMKLVAHVLHALGDTNRTLFLYDTFEGMTEPDPTVDIDFSGNQATNDWREVQRRGVKWSYAPVEEVYEILATSEYPMEKVKLVKGAVEETIPRIIPASIALLRLDTDWCSSTKHEMEHLYPKLSPQGILILDDYGHYQGARRGVDEYLSKLDKKPLLHRIDYCCRLAVKPTA